MNGLEWMGFAEWLVVAITAGLVVAGIAATRMPARRETAIVLLVAAALPLVVVALGTVNGVVDSFQVIETLRAPTPKDLAGGAVSATFGFLLAVMGSLVSCIAPLAILMRSPTRDAPLPLPV